MFSFIGLIFAAHIVTLSAETILTDLLATLKDTDKAHLLQKLKEEEKPKEKSMEQELLAKIALAEKMKEEERAKEKLKEEELLEKLALKIKEEKSSKEKLKEQELLGKLALAQKLKEEEQAKEKMKEQALLEKLAQKLKDEEKAKAKPEEKEKPAKKEPEVPAAMTGVVKKETAVEKSKDNSVLENTLEKLGLLAKPTEGKTHHEEHDPFHDLFRGDVMKVGEEFMDWAFDHPLSHFQLHHANRNYEEEAPPEEMPEEHTKGVDGPEEEAAEETAHGNMHQYASWTHVSDEPEEPATNHHHLSAKSHRHHTHSSMSATSGDDAGMSAAEKEEEARDREEWRKELALKANRLRAHQAHEHPSHWNLIYGPIVCLVLLSLWKHRAQSRSQRSESRGNYHDIGSGVNEFGFDQADYIRSSRTSVFLARVWAFFGNTINEKLKSDISSAYVPGFGDSDRLFNALRRKPSAKGEQEYAPLE